MAGGKKGEEKQPEMRGQRAIGLYHRELAWLARFMPVLGVGINRDRRA